MSEAVLDASALLNEEPGHEEAARTIRDAAISAVNLSEVAAKLAEGGMPEEAIREALEWLALDVYDFGREPAFRTAMPRPQTKHRGLSLADRACLAPERRLDLPVITADRAWGARSGGGGQAGKVLETPPRYRSPRATGLVGLFTRNSKSPLKNAPYDQRDASVGTARTCPEAAPD